MPQSGPGRQSFRRGSKKRKGGKKETSPAGSPVPEKALDLTHHTPQHRLSMAPTETTADSAQLPDDDAFAITQLADQIDEYYYGVRIFPGQDPANVVSLNKNYDSNL